MTKVKKWKGKVSVRHRNWCNRETTTLNNEIMKISGVEFRIISQSKVDNTILCFVEVEVLKN